MLMSNSKAMISIKTEHLEIVDEILQKYPYKFYVYGSKVKGTNKKLSNLDLCFFDNILDNVVSHIEEYFDNSNLPFIVEIVNWNHCNDNFKELIKDALIDIIPKVEN
mgnify:CR=1 FL=1